MKTQTLNEEDDDSKQEQTLSIPFDIISAILTRLPTKPLLRFKQVSKQWQSLISSPSFIKRHSIAHNHSTPSLLMVAYDTKKRHLHLLSFPRATSVPTSRADVTATHLLSITDVPPLRCETTQIEHLNGLVLLTSGNGLRNHDFAFLINPSTRKSIKLNAPASVSVYKPLQVDTCYLFGYDESSNEHKVLNIRLLKKTFGMRSVEIMLFELSSFEWRKIDAEMMPVDICEEDCYECVVNSSVCVNSIIHLMLQHRNEILAFDLRKETFEIIKIPNEALPCKYMTFYHNKGIRMMKSNQPVLMKVNGFLGVLCHKYVTVTNEMDIWMLKDCEERVWVKEKIVFRESWVDMEDRYPLGCVNVDEMAFLPKRVSKDMIRVLVYDMKTRSFKSVKFYLRGHFLRTRIEFSHVRSYVQSILPLERNAASTS